MKAICSRCMASRWISNTLNRRRQILLRELILASIRVRIRSTPSVQALDFKQFRDLKRFLLAKTVVPFLIIIMTKRVLLPVIWPPAKRKWCRSKRCRFRRLAILISRKSLRRIVNNRGLTLGRLFRKFARIFSKTKKITKAYRFTNGNWARVWTQKTVCSKANKIFQSKWISLVLRYFRIWMTISSLIF